MASTAEDIVNKAYDQAIAAKNLVDENFQNATDYVNECISAANAAIADISSASDFDITVPTDLSAPELLYSSQGVLDVFSTMPEVPASFAPTLPDAPEVPELESLPLFTVFVSSINTFRSDMIAKLQTMLSDGVTGLDETVEELLWERARQRQELQNIAQYDEANQYFSSRGYVLPPGALAGRLAEISVEIERNNANINNDITVEQARLAQANTHFMLEKGALIVMEEMKTSMDAVLKQNEKMIQSYSLSVEKFKQDMAVEIAEMESTAKVYSTQADVFRAVAAVAAEDINARKVVDEVTLKYVEATANLKLRAAEVILDKSMRAFGMQIEAAKAAAQLASQMTAGALSSIHASASISGSANLSGQGSASLSYSSQDQTSKQEVHTYTESV